MDRVDVYKALDSERDYQDAMTTSADRPDMVEIGMPAILLAMEHQLAVARTTWYGDNAPYKDTMEAVRKVGGLAVKAGEQYGMPRRSGF